MFKAEIEALQADYGFVTSTFNKNDTSFHGKARCTQTVHVEQANNDRGPNLEISGDNQHIFENLEATENDFRTSGHLDGAQSYYGISAHHNREQIQMTKTQTRVFIRRRKGIIIEQKRRFQSLRATRTAQSQVNISKCILRGAETGGIRQAPQSTSPPLYYNNGEFRKEIAKIVGVNKHSLFDPNKMELRDS
ncbi:MAG: hypothetical protein EZS28_016823 [Streblomastix strix]|uniref:Uncharacterized protein n=1 Tax=Streblomastix strix TaxID=222440 RepID=A0A5J4VYP2_9EUKA|nr:MAG: hypothetical protein EZS28_016823 [Streblomastix strix]